jgi:hypothetical protein
MKTTIEIPDDLLREAKEYAARHGLPLREVVVRGIRSIVKGSPQPRKFKLKTIAMGGSGILPRTGQTAPPGRHACRDLTLQFRPHGSLLLSPRHPGL